MNIVFKIHGRIEYWIKNKHENLIITVHNCVAFVKWINLLFVKEI
mgnify:CR=1 FL=1